MTYWTLDQAQITADLQAMVRINSINPGLAADGAGEGEIAAWLFNRCRMLGLEVELQETAPGRPNVIARWRGTGRGRSLLLTGHTDVVDTAHMPDDPFSARVEAGRLYGRGALDMKGGLAAFLGAAAALKASGFQPAGDLWLGFVTDEEFASIGADALVKRVKADAAILSEPTDCQICIAHKGFAWLTVTTEGVAAHGSRHDVGVDAIAHMGRILAEVERLNREHFPQNQHPLLGRASAHASLIGGGLGLSTYPDACTLQIEHRLLPDETPEEVMALWQSALDRLASDDPQFRARAALDLTRPGYEIAPEAPIALALHDACLRAGQTSPEYTGMSAWLDSAVFAAAGIPTIIYGPGGDGMHGPVEYVLLDDVFHCAAVFADTAAEWCGGA